MRIESLKEAVWEIKDPRRPWGNLRHKLEEIVIIGLCTIICGGEDFDDMEEFGVEREEWLREFLELPNGIPGDDTFRRVFERLIPAQLSVCLGEWLGANRKESKQTVNIDGKTICGRANAQHSAFHVVSAWVAEHEITLGELAVAEKTNEITAIPQLLDMLDIAGDTVTTDAMGCQKAIAKKICEKQADYVLALKGNQPNLYEDVRQYFEAAAQKPHFYEEVTKTVTSEKGHGRFEKRFYYLSDDIGWLEQRLDWKGLRAIGAVRSLVEEKSVVREETRYYITTLVDANDFANAVRAHWSIENQLHWMLDVVFREDAARAHKDNSPLNINVLRKAALSLLKTADLGRQLSIRKKMLKAALNPLVLHKVLFQN